MFSSNIWSTFDELLQLWSIENVQTSHLNKKWFTSHVYELLRFLLSFSLSLIAVPTHHSWQNWHRNILLLITYFSLITAHGYIITVKYIHIQAEASSWESPLYFTESISTLLEIQGWKSEFPDVVSVHFQSLCGLFRNFRTQKKNILHTNNVYSVFKNPTQPWWGN